ncbi:2-succinyl-6-hydroxy-2,4-cyclohexadiene-1-carboxylate synthase [Leuconostocaceae bacterium ESL0723]|nr:2-succinyl-6-hydroxy-2,4-cyclohexadiene-1-carboxylate synthase [Leuconostocaceae bacterium ESL0723]
MTEFMVSVGGYDYHLYQQVNPGSQQKWLLLHGFMGSHQDFDSIVDRLPGEVWRLDLLGYGSQRLPVNPNRLSMANQISDLTEICDRLGMTNVNLLGYSMGGRLAIALALNPGFAPHIHRLILESTTAGLPTPAQQQARRQLDEQRAQLILKDYPRFVDQWAQAPLFASQTKLAPTIRAQVRQQRLTQNPLNMANSLRVMGTGSQPNFWPRLGQIKVPVDVLAGREDPKFTRLAQQLTSSLPNAHLHLIDGAGHNLHLEQPATFAQEISSHVFD